MTTGAPQCRIKQNVVGSILFFAAADAGLFLADSAFQEEIALADLLDRLVSVNREQLSDAISDALTARYSVEIRARVLLLCQHPCPRTKRVLILQPAITFRHRNAMQD